MKPEEFKTQIFKTPEQWRSGLLYRLEMIDGGVITLYSTPTFTKWIQEIDGIKSPVGLALDECEQVYFIDRERCQLYLYDPKVQRLERIPCISGCGSAHGEFRASFKITERSLENLKSEKVPDDVLNKLANIKNQEIIGGKEFLDVLKTKIGDEKTTRYKSSILKQVEFHPTRIIIGKFTLWVLDMGNHRVQAFSRENFQLKYIIDKYKIKDEIKCALKEPIDIEPVDIGLDEHGCLYILDRKLHQIFKYNINGLFIKSFGESCLKEPVGLAVGKDNNLYVIDRGYRGFLKFKELEFSFSWDEVPGNDSVRLIEFLTQNFDVNWVRKAEIKKSDDGKTINISDGKNSLSLGLNDKKTKVILTINGVRTDEFIVKMENGKFKIQGKCSEIGDFKKISEEFKPSIITIDKRGNIFVVDDQTGLIHQFDSDGSYIGKNQIPEFTGSIQGLATDSKGNLYASSNRGIAFFNTQEIFTKEQGIYYSKTLDSGIHKCQWHSLAFEAGLPPRTLLEVYYYSSDDTALKRRIDEVLSDPNKSIQEKKESIENLIPEKEWIGPETLSNLNRAVQGKTDFKDKKTTGVETEKNKTEKDKLSMLFRKKTGRYLWLKLVLSTFEENVRPSVTEMRVYYPRISYLRYLPAVYQEDPISKDFLERFLSIFETVFYDLETRISRVSKYFDLDTVPQDFLTWLASWLNLALEEEWPEDKKRQFIQKASTLYKLKGTPTGIEALIEIYTGRKPLILEHSRTGKPMVLGGRFRLGVNSLLIQTPVRGFRLGNDSILGRVALRDTVQSPEDPFLQTAHRFTIILDLPTEKFAHYEKGLRRILNEEKPAHTVYNLRVVKEMKVGIGTYVGISTRVADYQPIRLGVNANIGSSIVVMDGEQGGRVERHSKLEKDTKLI